MERFLFWTKKEIEDLNVVYENLVIYTDIVTGTGDIYVADDRFVIRVVECME